jgi:SAM-dependent methyltransferase
MELTSRRIRSIWLQAAKPIYPVDSKLVNAAASSGAENKAIYAPIQNPSTHFIYRYLTEFAARVLETHSGRPLKELRILDWGAGKGYAAYFLQSKGAHVTLYEMEAFEHRAIWDKFKLDVKTSPDGTLPFADKTFDAVVSFGVLEHVPYDYEALKELNRVLKDDGLFFCFNLPNRTGYIHRVAWWRGVRYHDRNYGRREIQTLLKRAGFNTIGRPWFRQLLPKNFIVYKAPRLVEYLDLFASNHTPLKYLAASIEFVARKQHAYTSQH